MVGQRLEEFLTLINQDYEEASYFLKDNSLELAEELHELLRAYKEQEKRLVDLEYDFIEANKEITQLEKAVEDI